MVKCLRKYPIRGNNAKDELIPKSWTNKPTKGGQFFNDKIQYRI